MDYHGRYGKIIWSGMQDAADEECEKMMNDKMNIILTGMPGSGKSTCGVLAAKAMCMEFLDTDLLIQSLERMALQDIINNKGIDYFSRAEEQALLSIHTKGCVIATGGSAVYYERAMEHLKEGGLVIHLKISCPEMEARIKNITTRGILLHPGESMQDMFINREVLYEKYADVVIDCERLTIEQTVEVIVSCSKAC